MVDLELLEVDELEAVALRQAPRVRRLGHALLGRLIDPVRVQHLHPWLHSGPLRYTCGPTTADNWNSGMYSASSRPAMTMPMMTSSAGSMSVTNRPRSVSISSS